MGLFGSELSGVNAMSNPAQAEILAASNAPGVYESGGGYGQKGIDFQRYWAISRIIELAAEDQTDFLILLESMQDVVEFDSQSVPTRATIYQLKMKDTGEWTWKALTALPLKPRRKKNSEEFTVPLPFCASPIGKLASAVAELETIQAEGVFVSNLGSSATMEKGSTAGSVKICKFSELSKDLRDQISAELAKLKKAIPLEALRLHKTELSLEDPDTHVVGKINAFLLKTAPKHAGQCKSFSDSLFAILSARGRKTDPSLDFPSLVSSRGFSKAEFINALESLRSVPDQQEVVNSWLAFLLNEKMPAQEYTMLQVKLLQLLEQRLRSGRPDQGPLNQAVRGWVTSNPVGETILGFLRAGTAAMTAQFSGIARHEIQAVLILEGISQCLNQT